MEPRLNNKSPLLKPFVLWKLLQIALNFIRMLIDAACNIPTLIYEVTWPITWSKTNEILILYRKTDFCTLYMIFVLFLTCLSPWTSTSKQSNTSTVQKCQVLVLPLIYVHRCDLGYTTGIPVITMAKNSNKLVCELLWHWSSKVLLRYEDWNFPGLQSLSVSESSSDSSPMSNRTTCGLLPSCSGTLISCIRTWLALVGLSVLCLSSGSKV